MTDIESVPECDQLIYDSGHRIAYADGAEREPVSGKGRYDLISPEAMMRIATWYELGAMKYSERNWEKGMPWSHCLNSAFRHLIKYMAGWTDEDHLAAVCWNVMALMHYESIPFHLKNNDIPNRK